MFIPTFLCFAAISILTISFVATHTENPIFNLTTILFCLTHTLSYLLVALKDPGVCKPQQYVPSGAYRTRYNMKNILVCADGAGTMSSVRVYIVWSAMCVLKGTTITVLGLRSVLVGGMLLLFMCF